MEKKILIFAYYSFHDPVFQSAVLPYFLNLPCKGEFTFVLLTFEHSKYPLTKSEIAGISEQLLQHKIIWHRLTWRSGRFKFIKKIIDFVIAMTSSISLIRRSRIKLVYSEGWPGALLSYYVTRITQTKHIVHSFEPHADYMVEAGIWTKNSWEAKLLRWHEKKIARHASFILTATRSYIERILEWKVNEKSLLRVPSCVDLDHFNFSFSARNKIREQFGIRPNDRVLVYMGKFGGMYMEEEAFEFFRYCQLSASAWIMILSTDDAGKIANLCSVFSLNKEKTIIKSLNRSEIPLYLSAADISFVAVRQKPSKKYCSPIKTGEYLACGLPVIVPRGISDDAEILEEKGVGIIMESAEKKSYQEVINHWLERINTIEPSEIRRLAREYAAKDRSVGYYKQLYCQLFQSL